MSLSLSLSFSLFLSLSLFLSSPPSSSSPFPFPPSHARRAEENDASVACARALNVHDRLFVTQTGRQGHEQGLTFIRV